MKPIAFPERKLRWERMPSSCRLMSAASYSITHFLAIRLRREHGSQLHTHTKRRVLRKPSTCRYLFPAVVSTCPVGPAVSASSWPGLGKINMRAPRNPRVLTYSHKVPIYRILLWEGCSLALANYGQPPRFVFPSPQPPSPTSHMRSLPKGKKIGL